MTTPIKHCATCGEPIVGRRSVALYCSKVCQWRRYNKARARMKACRKPIKQCTVCGKEIVGRRSDALYCSKACQDRRYYKTNGEDARARTRARRNANLEQWQAQERAYYDANQERIRAQARARHESNPEIARSQHRAWCQANRRKYLAYKKVYRETHPEQVRAQLKAWTQANRGKLNAQARVKYQDEKIAYDAFVEMGLMPTITKEGKVGKEYSKEKRIHQQVALVMLREWQKAKRR